MAKHGVEGGDYADGCKDGDLACVRLGYGSAGIWDGHIRPVQFLEPWVAVETVVDAWDGGSPHQNYDAEVVKLNAKGLDLGTVIEDKMESGCLIIGNRWAVGGRVAYVVDKKKHIATP